MIYTVQPNSTLRDSLGRVWTHKNLPRYADGHFIVQPSQPVQQLMYFPHGAWGCVEVNTERLPAFQFQRACEILRTNAEWTFNLGVLQCCWPNADLPAGVARFMCHGIKTHAPELSLAFTNGWYALTRGYTFRQAGLYELDAQPTYERFDWLTLMCLQSAQEMHDLLNSPKPVDWSL